MDTKKFIGGLLAGAAVGIAIGMLLAPRSGEQTQQRIVGGSKRLANDLKNAVGDSIDSLKNRYNGVVDSTAKRGKEAISQGSDHAKV